MYVKRKFDNYKEETLSHLNIKFYKNQVVTKAEQFIQTNTVKSMTAANLNYRYNYGITAGTPINLNHIISLILYTDFTEYCSKFSGTFRSLSINETMQDVKTRNTAFWFQSKYFREVVEIYGHSTGETGPFFSGVNCVLCIPQFALRLNSPTSTSKHIEVSINFATRDGMIIELSNNGHYRADELSIFDVSWLSRYPDQNCGNVLEFSTNISCCLY